MRVSIVHLRLLLKKKYILAFFILHSSFFILKILHFKTFFSTRPSE